MRAENIVWNTLMILFGTACLYAFSMALVRIARVPISDASKVFWLLFVVLMPLLGVPLFFMQFKKSDERPEPSNRRIVKRVATAFAVVLALLGAHVMSLVAWIYFDAAGMLPKDGFAEEAMETYYWPASEFTHTDLPGAETLNQLLDDVADAGRRRRK